jgi:hypothetical protein
LSALRDVFYGARDLFRYLAPPHVDDELERRWRMRITGAVLIVSSALIGHMFVSETWPWNGPVAHASTQQELSNKLDALLTQVGRNYKITLSREICRLWFLRQTASGDLHRQLNETYESKQSEYTDLNDDKRYPVAECSPPAPS